MRLGPCSKTDHHRICNPGLPRRKKTAAQTVGMFKERSWKEFGRRLDSDNSSANKVLWQTIRQMRGKNFSTIASFKDSTKEILKDEKKILSQ